jgi:hypothetical protein
MASLVSLHTEIARLHHQDVLAQARRGQLLSSAATRRNLLRRALCLVALRRNAARQAPVLNPLLET